MTDNQTTGASLPWVLISSFFAIICIFIFSFIWHDQYGISGLPVAAAIAGVMSAFFWIISAYLPDIEARRLNATAGAYSGGSIVLGTGALPNMFVWWPTIACVSGFLLIVLTLPMGWRSKSEKGTNTTDDTSWCENNR